MQFNRAVLARMQPDSREAFSGELEEHLALRSKKGSSDDISMSIVFHSEMDYEACENRQTSPLAYREGIQK